MMIEISVQVEPPALQGGEYVSRLLRTAWAKTIHFSFAGHPTFSANPAFSQKAAAEKLDKTERSCALSAEKLASSNAT